MGSWQLNNFDSDALSKWAVTSGDRLWPRRGGDRLGHDLKVFGDPGANSIINLQY